MNKVDLKLVLASIVLLVVALISFLNWSFVSSLIIQFLTSKILTFCIWAILTIVSIIHYFRNHEKDKNLISDKDGLEKPIDYFQFVATFGAIGSSIQILARETFASINFSKLAKCSEFSKVDIFSFFIVIIVLVFYSYNKIKPIFIETFVSKSKIRLAEEDGKVEKQN